MVHQYPLSPELEELLVATDRVDHIRDHFLQALHLLLTVTGARPNVQPPEELSALTQPVQLIWGKADPFGDVDLGPCDTTYARKRVRGRHRGHAPWLSASNEIGPLVESFLKNNLTLQETLRTG